MCCGNVEVGDTNTDMGPVRQYQHGAESSDNDFRNRQSGEMNTAGTSHSLRPNTRLQLRVTGERVGRERGRMRPCQNLTEAGARTTDWEVIGFQEDVCGVGWVKSSSALFNTIISRTSLVACGWDILRGKYRDCGGGRITKHIQKPTTACH